MEAQVALQGDPDITSGPDAPNPSVRVGPLCVARVYRRATAGSRSAMLVDCQTRLRARLPARAQSIAPLRRSVVELADGSGASQRQCEDIALAVSEALSNAVLHAYVGCDEPGSLALDAWMAGSMLEVVVGDEGIGMRPRADSPGLGFGMGLIFRMTEQLRVDSRDDVSGVRVRMTFAIG